MSKVAFKGIPYPEKLHVHVYIFESSACWESTVHVSDSCCATVHTSGSLSS